jgi:hypothetical protein
MRRAARSFAIQSVAILLFAAGLPQPAALARPPHKQTLKKYYGDLLSEKLVDCRMCHLTREQSGDPDFDADAPPHNAFGIRLRELGEQLEAAGKPTDLVLRLQQVAAEDSDGDGVPNELEILSGHFPGDKTDRPTEAELAEALKKQAAFHAAISRGYAWAPFRPVVRPPLPAGGDRNWIRTPIDAFISAEHEKRGLKPRPEASREVLLRRVYLDLIGLPPTPEELHAFLADRSPDAYERVVDRLLASPHYGERWGRHWMDVWRYSDWAGWGQQVRDSQPHIWRWRDWIIESLNADKPYDRMVVEMLAGDEAAPGDPDVLRATGFLVRNFKLLSREQWMQDTVEHTTKAFLGLTLNCARCHNHMYDPIAQSEYYQVRAVFEPYEVRLDRVPGVVDTKTDGLPRIFDAKPEAPTYLFVRGDERDFNKDKPLAPAAIKLLGGANLALKPVELPAAAYYPGLQPFVEHDALAAAESEIKKSAETLANQRHILERVQKTQESDAEWTAIQAEARSSGLVPAQGPASRLRDTEGLKLAVSESEKHLAAAEASRADLAARIAADHVKYSTPRAPQAADLAKLACKAERQTAALRAEEAVAHAELHLRELRAAEEPQPTVALAAGAGAKAVPDARPPETAKPADAAKPQPSPQQQAAAKAVAEAEKDLAGDREALEKARQAVEQPSEEYSPLTPVYPKTSTGRRLAFARWIADPKNPLTARVAVNHIWLRHFEHGIVPSVFDFGQNGQPPTHPELLDWLAAELMARNWSTKAIHRLIVTSATYRMESSGDEANRRIDADNKYLWQMPRKRMEAEIVRDSVLYIAGQLDDRLGGPDIDQELGQTVKRRSVYFRSAAEKQMTFLKLFDEAAVNDCYQRKESIVPQQALALVNSELTLEQARLLARRLGRECEGDPRRFVTAAFERVLSRAATPAEEKTCLEFLSRQTKLFDAERARLTTVASDPADGTKPSPYTSERAHENLVHALLNHSDFVTIH